MDFETLPPEINSGRMYCGPGSGSIMVAATAWDQLAGRLYDTAAYWRAVTSKLAQGPQGPQGPAAIAMTQASAPYIGWLNATAAQAEHAATQAAAAASIHESALAAMVPPQVINANRAQRISLSTTNCLGQNSPAIADIDAEYEQMWATDTDAMYAYAGASADASTVTPFTSPPATTAGPAGQGVGTRQASGAWTLSAAPEIISAGYQVISTIPEAMRALSSSPLTTLDAPLSSVTSSLSKLSSLSAPSGFAITHLSRLNKDAALMSFAPNQGRVSRAAFTAGFGRGRSIGTLSVPPGWVTETTISPVIVELRRSWVCKPIRLVKATGAQLAGQGGFCQTSGTDGGG
jgi:PPE-repeat protein